MNEDILNDIFINSMFYQYIKDNYQKFKCVYYEDHLILYTFNNYNDDGSISVDDVYYVKVTVKMNEYCLLIKKNGLLTSEEICYQIEENRNKRLIK